MSAVPPSVLEDEDVVRTDAKHHNCDEIGAGRLCMWSDGW